MKASTVYLRAARESANVAPRDCNCACLKIAEVARGHSNKYNSVPEVQEFASLFRPGDSVRRAWAHDAIEDVNDPRYSEKLQMQRVQMLLFMWRIALDEEALERNPT